MSWVVPRPLLMGLSAGAPSYWKGQGPARDNMHWALFSVLLALGGISSCPAAYGLPGRCGWEKDTRRYSSAGLLLSFLFQNANNSTDLLHKAVVK